MEYKVITTRKKVTGQEHLRHKLKAFDFLYFAILGAHMKEYPVEFCYLFSLHNYIILHIIQTLLHFFITYSLFSFYKVCYHLTQLCSIFCFHKV